MLRLTMCPFHSMLLRMESEQSASPTRAQQWSPWPWPFRGCTSTLSPTSSIIYRHISLRHRKTRLVTFYIMLTLCLNILTKFLLLSLWVDINFETFTDAFSLLVNPYKFLPILFRLYNRRIEMNFQGAKKRLARFFLGKLTKLALLVELRIFELFSNTK